VSELLKLSILEASKKLRSKEIKATELVDSYIKQAKKTKDLNAFSLETFDFAREEAKKSQERLDNNTARPLEGIPVAVKDLFCTKGFRTTSCSKMLADFIPPYDSTVSSKLLGAGGIMIGKTGMDEFAMGSSNGTSYFGGVINPWRAKDNPDKKLVPGGSSGGSSASVSAFSSMAALGSDTGGSIRQPAAYTATVGIKPSYGRCSRYGMVAFSSSLDQAGVLARSVADASLVLENVMGHDEFDSTVQNLPVPQLSKLSANSMKGLKVGVPKEYDHPMLSSDIKASWEKAISLAKAQGAEIVEISMPHTSYALPVYYIIAPAEASSNLSRYDGVRFGYRTTSPITNINDLYEYTRAEGFGAEVKRRIMIGTFVLSSEHISSYYQKAQRVRTLIIEDFKKAFEKVDVILTPTTPTPAFGLEDKLDPVSMYMNDLFTVPASLAGLPCMSLPIGINESGLPLGIQLIAKHLDEETMIKAALSLEEAISFKLNAYGM